MRISSWYPRMVIMSAIVFAAAANAQAPAASNGAPAPLDAARRRGVVDTLSARLIRHYVDADTGLLIAARMRSRLTSGAYDAITSPARFAEVLTTDLRSVNGDRHLNVTYAPEQPGLRPGPEGIRMGNLPSNLPTT